MQNREQIIERLLDTPAAKKAAAEIESEKQAKRLRIEKRIEELSSERSAVVQKAETSLTAARLDFAKKDAEFKQARTEFLRAGHATDRAKALHFVEIRGLREQLAQMDSTK